MLLRLLTSVLFLSLTNCEFSSVLHNLKYLMHLGKIKLKIFSPYYSQNFDLLEIVVIPFLSAIKEGSRLSTGNFGRD